MLTHGLRVSRAASTSVQMLADEMLADDNADSLIR